MRLKVAAGSAGDVVHEPRSSCQAMISCIASIDGETSIVGLQIHGEADDEIIARHLADAAHDFGEKRMRFSRRRPICRCGDC